ncbi:type II toxin-antitoxin system HipA family toxin [Roseateles asaccharophilus]|uniref:type II toxin-antitoxin system HipA family toxin n=1 Tax=Roseateles asaccharophilus TaxID=582607 RepID=UPI00384E5FFD
MARLQLHTPQSVTPRPIGWISQCGDVIRVTFDDDYISDRRRPTLSQSLRGASPAAEMSTLSSMTDKRLVRIGKLPTFFSNLLPEGVNRERLASARGCSEEDELELLSAAGHDLSGGIEIAPGHNVPRSVLELHATQGLEPLEPSAVASPMDDGFSVDGFQTKFSMVHDGRRYVVRRGAAAGDFIAKLPSTTFPDLALNEAICYQLASAVGIKTAGAVSRPIDELDVPAHVKSAFDEFLLVPRFDRFKRADGTTGRIHFEELTQALNLESKEKYKDIPAAMSTLLTILKSSPGSSDEELDEFFRRWTAYALMGNTDAHIKNWGLLYRDGINPSLAPAYDMVCVTAYFDPQDSTLLAQNRKMDENLRKWGEDQAEQLAKSAGLLAFKRFRRIVRETQQEAVALWPTLLEGAPERVRVTILKRLQEMVPSPAPRVRLRAQP